MVIETTKGHEVAHPHSLHVGAVSRSSPLAPCWCCCWVLLLSLLLLLLLWLLLLQAVSLSLWTEAFHKHCCLSPCEGRTLRDASNRKLHWQSFLGSSNLKLQLTIVFEGVGFISRLDWWGFTWFRAGYAENISDFCETLVVSSFPVGQRIVREVVHRFVNMSLCSSTTCVT